MTRQHKFFKGEVTCPHCGQETLWSQQENPDCQHCYQEITVQQMLDMITKVQQLIEPDPDTQTVFLDYSSDGEEQGV